MRKNTGMTGFMQERRQANRAVEPVAEQGSGVTGDSADTPFFDTKVLEQACRDIAGMTRSQLAVFKGFIDGNMVTYINGIPHGHLEEEKGFYSLCARVAEINPEAAEILVKHEFPAEAQFGPGSELNACMLWSETSQGVMYWGDIDKELWNRHL